MNEVPTEECYSCNPLWLVHNQPGLKEASLANWQTLCCCHQRQINTSPTVSVPTIPRRSIWQWNSERILQEQLKQALVINFNQGSGLAVGSNMGISFVNLTHPVQNSWVTLTH